MRVVRLSGMIALLLAGAACAASITPLPPAGAAAPVRVAPPSAPPRGADLGLGGLPTVPPPSGWRTPDETDEPVRVALATGQTSAEVSGTGDWRLFDATGEHQLARARSGERWTVVLRGDRLQATSSDGATTVPFAGPLVARPASPGAVLRYGPRRYRGELLVMRAQGGLAVVNRLSVEEYLRGVVPLEIGPDRTPFEAAAVEAQAVAARSYAYTRLDDSRPWDLSATVVDQVYGGMDAERPVSDAAIAATRDQVLLYHGRVINAPYHSTSGGITAAASEVWRDDAAPYLVSVSDRIPGTDRYYDEDAPRFRWTRTFDGAELQQLASRYLPRYAGAPAGGVGSVRGIEVTGRTASGRVAGLAFVTDRGRFAVRGNGIRYVLRSRGDVLPSTLFQLDVVRDGSGRVSRVVVNGAGNGHGVGMDQWGAIGRARAGQSYVAILSTYYPGTRLGRIG